MIAELSAIQAILFDTGGVLYHRPRQDRQLAAFLQQHGLKSRPRHVLEGVLRAARFDVQTGRISRDEFYDAILRMHEVRPPLFAAGRDALLRDAADIELFPGVVETLSALHGAGYRLATVSDTAHTAGHKISWLAARKVPPGLWAVFIVSVDNGSTKAEPAIFKQALHQLGVAAFQAAFVGHATVELACAQHLGITTIAFLPDDPGVQTDYTIGSFYGLQDLFLEKGERR